MNSMKDSEMLDQIFLLSVKAFLEDDEDEEFSPELSLTRLASSLDH